MRVVKRAKGETTHYVFEGTEPIFEKRINAGKAKSYVYALGKYLARVDGVIGDSNAKKYFYHTDHAGSIRVITDQAGKVVYKADYFAFGIQFVKDGDFEELHGFTGKEYDPDIGLYYFNARWYDPDLGRFISEDPVADPNNPNLYSYCGNNPVMRVDPSGKIWGILIGALLGGLDAYLCGGDFMQGFVMGAFTGALGGAVGSALQNTAWGAALAKSSGIGFSAVSGAIGGGITGELFGEGFGKGAVYGAVGGVISYGVDMRFGEYASKSTFNKLIINGLKGGLNGLARGGDFIEGFGYGFAYGFAYEYADKFGYENNTTTDVQFDFSGAKLEGGTLLASNDPNVNRQAIPAHVSGLIEVKTITRDAKGRIIKQKIDLIRNGETVHTVTQYYSNGKLTRYTVTNYYIWDDLTPYTVDRNYDANGRLISVIDKNPYGNYPKDQAALGPYTNYNVTIPGLGLIPGITFGLKVGEEVHPYLGFGFFTPGNCYSITQGSNVKHGWGSSFSGTFHINVTTDNEIGIGFPPGAGWSMVYTW